MKEHLLKEEDRIRKVKSLYKKSELISLYEEKEEMMKSMKEGLEYEHFLKALNKKKYMTALSNLKKKEKAEKVTT